ncbi:MAG: hypothetical protein ACRERC_16345 [Candidatus Binatia bacterium]
MGLRVRLARAGAPAASCLILFWASTAAAGLVEPRQFPVSGCVADCDRDGAIAVSELLRGVAISLETASVARCAAADRDGDKRVTVDEVLTGVAGALDGCPAAAADPGVEPWALVPENEVGARCGLDPALLVAADPIINRPYAVVRYGQLCHVYYPQGSDPRGEIFSTTKTLGALTTGVAAYQTRDLPRTGRKTGPLSDEDRVDHWLDSFTFNPDAHIAHVLAMLAHNPDLSTGNRLYQYDLVGAVQINRLSDVITTAIQQDTERLGNDVEEFVQRFLFGPLGITDSLWTNGTPNKILGFTWHSTVLDMARIGLLILHDGLWSGSRILDSDWTYKMTHPSFEDANTGYGYLTWMNSASNYTQGFGVGPKAQARIDPCAPVSIFAEHPHGLSEALDCNYEGPVSCEQQFDVGMWFAAGLGGQYIVGHRGLDLVLVVKDSPAGPAQIWRALRPALLALDPDFSGDEAGFCAAYAAGDYAPDLL